jgi:TolC family type I secretion outer membrane protein
MIGLVMLLLLSGIPYAGAQEGRLTLDECVELALKQNPDIIRGEFTLKMAGKDMTIAMSNFLPQVSGQMGYYHSEIGPTLYQRIDPGTGIPVPALTGTTVAWGSYAGVSVRQTILNGGSNIFGMVQSKHLKRSAEYTFDDTRQTTIYIVKERYYNLLASEKLLEVAEETLKSSSESYKRADVFNQVGKAPKSDVLKAKVQLESDRLALIEAQNALAIARASLNHILGFDVDQTIRVVDNLNIPEMEVEYEDVMDNALTNHPYLLMSTYNEKANKAGVGVSLGQFLPGLSAYFSYDWSHKDFDEIGSALDRNYRWSMGVSLSVPIFSGFYRLASLNKSRLLHLSSKAALDQAKRDIALEAKQAYFDVEQAKKKIAVTENQVEAAEEDLRLNREKYNLGAGTMLNLIDAQVSAASAKSENIQALYTYKFAIARLQKAMGKLDR